MKILQLVISFILLAPFQMLSQEFNVVSYNIRYNNAYDNENWWGHRKEAVVHLLNENTPLVFGVQEAVDSQMDYLDNELENYSYIGVGRDDGKRAGEFSAIFYRDDLKVLESGTFWLSPTPDKISKGWDAALPRVCTYAKFEMESGEQFWHFNTHFDHQGVEARANSAKLIIDKIKELTEPQDAIVLTGDFNTTPDKNPYANITNYLDDSAKESMSKPTGPKGTFNGFRLDAELQDRIDYIFSKNLKTIRYTHLDTKRPNGLWVSDHLPIVATVSLIKKF